ncbi:Com family DNA-binding transcriptional regulator [Stutzerimonas nitrititolerans]|uniref:Com family DNA-binding transcriptional regulator n=1 Tax=Stutzerimonas nitrititolerans TaxID=2482751 RepID=UPI00289A6318|nr:Com family DNA-binding transcriptional regulator [Stutzerimonas nitrititolerans]
MQKMRDCRCGKCNRLLARVGEYSSIQIKCSRCGTLNHMKTESLVTSPVSDLDAAKADIQTNR